MMESPSIKTSAATGDDTTAQVAVFLYTSPLTRGSRQVFSLVQASGDLS